MHFRHHPDRDSPRADSPVAEYIDAILPIYERRHPEMDPVEAFGNVREIARNIHASPKPDVAGRMAGPSHTQSPLRGSPANVSHSPGVSGSRDGPSTPSRVPYSSSHSEETALLKKLHITPGPGELEAQSETSRIYHHRPSVSHHPVGVTTVEGRRRAGEMEHWKKNN
ncbi:hypothetical protein BJ684DRAFT_22021 [Piptocephalis cylindrospora]|uniref:Uncharacterized protein n=1 Tax=Piptocephalis cylindrospora TaxID=1907219 RepID=A0A4P9XYC4_9FUNG|nr:hypothetical protein BJ684DRAFT_22021 [Piptocephalis cylindrospora]|eukprot:RKP11416.1 hypothetical protein BJ684DRAFT_22021 [Piptocephalis cylindrospora]